MQMIGMGRGRFVPHCKFEQVAHVSIARGWRTRDHQEVPIADVRIQHCGVVVNRGHLVFRGDFWPYGKANSFVVAPAEGRRTNQWSCCSEGLEILNLLGGT